MQESRVRLRNPLVIEQEWAKVGKAVGTSGKMLDSHAVLAFVDRRLPNYAIPKQECVACKNHLYILFNRTTSAIKIACSVSLTLMELPLHSSNRKMLCSYHIYLVMSDAFCAQRHVRKTRLLRGVNYAYNSKLSLHQIRHSQALAPRQCPAPLVH